MADVPARNGLVVVTSQKNLASKERRPCSASRHSSWYPKAWVERAPGTKQRHGILCLDWESVRNWLTERWNMRIDATAENAICGAP
jgi:hypothetical protein